MLCWLSQCMCRGRGAGRECVQPEMGMGRSLQSMFLNMEEESRFWFTKPRHLGNPSGSAACTCFSFLSFLAWKALRAAILAQGVHETRHWSFTFDWLSLHAATSTVYGKTESIQRIP